MTTKEILQANIVNCEQALAAAQATLDEFNASPENNVFDTLDEALGTIEDALLDLARADCEGSYNCGSDSYQQEFIVGGIHYIGTLRCEYNRHDKTYYYVDGHTFTHAAAPVQQAA